MDEWSLKIKSVLADIQNQTVQVHGLNSDKDRWSFGSGLVLDRYHVVTHANTVYKCDQITVRTLEGTEYEAEAIGFDPLYFLAVIKTFQRMEIAPPVFLPSDQLETGDLVLAVGNPLGDGVTVSMGVVSSPNRTIYRPERFPVDGLVVTDASIHPGNTCGPLVTMDGKVAGLNGIPWIHGLSLAVQSGVVQRVANQIIEYGRASHPWLGFSGEIKIIDRALVNLFELPVDRGIVVSHINGEGPGAKAGVELMDMVVRVDNRPVKDLGFIRQTLANYHIGDQVPLTVLRGGELKEMTIPVEEIPQLNEIEFEDED